MKLKLSSPIIAVLLLAVLTTGFFLSARYSDPALAVKALAASLSPTAAEDELSKTVASVFRAEVLEIDRALFSAVARLELSALDASKITDGLSAEMQEYLELSVYEASEAEEAYDENGDFLPELREEAYDHALSGRLSHAEDYIKHEQFILQLKYSFGKWTAENLDELKALVDTPIAIRPDYERECAKLQYISLHRRLSDLTSPAPEPNPLLFGETDDPAVLEKLLQGESAKRLIGERKLTWSPDIKRLPGSLIHYYLDETIFTVVWQEVECGAVATFAETVIGDATQLRRKLAGDEFGSYELYVPSELSAQANAVLGLSGDFYGIAGRSYGVFVYNGEVMGCYPTAGQSCYFTDSGDMLFSRENDFASKAEAQAFVDDNNIMFSLNFGPVLIDGGIDVTPDDYVLGEVTSGYARCAVAQMGELHYLSMAVNVKTPEYNIYITQKQATDILMRRGCPKAYALDGGQTATIVINNKVINPVQFYAERPMSDIFYFATAMDG